MQELIAFGLKFKGLKKENLLKTEQYIKFIITVNSEFIYIAQKNKKFRNIINNNFATFDGQIPYLMTKNKIKKVSFEKISGADLIYDIINIEKRKGGKVFILGGQYDSNKYAVERLNREINAVGYSPPYFEKKMNDVENKKIIDYLVCEKPKYLLVCFGAKKQEFWIQENIETLNDIGIKFVIGAGGTVDFLSGKIRRAPLYIQRLGLEGLYRFFKEPKLFRLKRIVKSLFVFTYLFNKKDFYIKEI